MKWHKEEFDSKIFGKDVYKILLDASSTREEMDEFLLSVSSGTIFGFVPVHSTLTSILENNGFHFVSIRHEYIYGGNTISSVQNQSEIVVEPFQTDQNISDEDVHALALTVGQETRYFKDPNIPRAISEVLYETWVRNSLYNGLASQCFLAWSGDKPIGICTTKLHGQEGEIDLLGVLPEFRTKKVGKLLVDHALKYLQNNSAQHITVVTSGENIPANIFFQKHLFYIKEVHLVYHKHL